MKKIINTDKAPAPLGPYNQAVFANNTLYISGQIAINPETNELITSGVEDEAKLVMKNLEAVLNAADMTFENVVKSSIFLNDMNDFTTINKIYGAYFDEATAPARETVAVKTLPKNVNVEISMIAVK
ncbi:Rid family detoxifying hydrolase [Galbibacter orientalis]|uniref:Endoribonuclease L-PSP, putative n=1 Tax=Galbibacter orientalis DSM 19592 TaxID=926559 RepID=I3C8X8_9FLAO|nr:Rid family detoxifying hydrolase [Galbibacter orientalis]EIJ40071.1 endoribonuclease L-PSP, putative [Galbibacter orientalis DSM 19592]|tara:strand:+ start:17 stop:397 length:381 start_codon:yes stop_codon:yes gene_type:complete